MKHIVTNEGRATVLTSVDQPPRRSSKTLFLDDGWRSVPSDDRKPFLHTFETVDFSSLDAMGKSAHALLDRRSSYIVRGDIIAGSITPCRRLTKPSGDDAPTICDAPKRWVTVDVDSGFDAPEDWLDDPEAFAQEIIEGTLPEPFHEAGCLVRWSGSMTPGPDPAKLHTTFLLDTAITTWQVKHWLGDLPHLDTSVFRPAQPIFTAAPLCYDQDGVILDDPLGDDRLFILEGEPVAVPDLPDAPREPEYSDDGADPEDVWLDAIPTDTMRIILDPSIQRLGDENIRVPPGEMRGMYEGMRALQFRYLCETYGRPRDKEWLRTLTRETILAHRKPLEQEHRPDFDSYLAEVCGPKFDAAWTSGIPRARQAALTERLGQVAEQGHYNPDPPPTPSYTLSEVERADLLARLDRLPGIALGYEQRGETAKAKAIRDLWREGA